MTTNGTTLRSSTVHWIFAMLLLAVAGAVSAQNKPLIVCMGSAADRTAWLQKSDQAKLSTQKAQIQILKAGVQLDNAHTQAELQFIQSNTHAYKKMAWALKAAMQELKVAEQELAVTAKQAQYAVYMASNCANY